MSSKPGPNGYVQFSIPRPDGKRWRDYLHQWVLWAFTGPAEPGQVARHLDDVRTNNHAENLCWGTKSENQHDITRNGIRTIMTHCKRGHDLAEVGTYPGNRCRQCRIDNSARRRRG